MKFHLIIRKFSPPGAEAETIHTITWTFVMILAGCLHSCFFLREYYMELETARKWSGCIVSFTQFMRDGFYTIFFAAGLFWMLFWAAVRYLRFYRDGSYMTMKRLPDSREMLKRAVLIPLVNGGLIASVGWTMTLINYYYYLTRTPAGLLPPVTW